jgi:CheY-like chemotaxis protein
MSHRRQRVLVVDDDATVGSFAQHVLTRLGYEVVVTTRSHEALATLQAAPQSFAALITDYTMPGLSGIALAAACRQVRGDLPIILCTGESPTVYAAQAAAQGIDAVLPKPYRPGELTSTLEQVLASHAMLGPRTPLTIIVVEDNPLDVYLIQWVLRAHDLAHELQVIENGDHAMDYVNQLAHEERRRSPTLMLLDLNLPQRDGRELLQRVKAIPQGADIRVVVVTSSTNPADRQETLALGADAYFVKPYHLQEFMQLGDLIKGLALGNGLGEPSTN